MRYSKLPGIKKQVSRICLGTAQYGSQISRDESFRLLDAFTESGGTFIDTAHVYGAWAPDGYNGGYGNSEAVIGAWLEKSGNRDKMVIGTKGAHPDVESEETAMTRRKLKTHLDESLKRLRTDYIDLYWLHRDEPSVPVGEILGWLNRFIEQGKISAIGCSNWRVNRQVEAEEAAADLGLHSFITSQVGWSLASSNIDIQKGNGEILFMTDEMELFHKDTGIAVVPFSSQAGGFFSSKYDGMDFNDPDFPKPGLINKYGNPLNFKRRKITTGLAEEKDCTANQVALAYLLKKPFPVFPIVGPRTIDQLKDSVTAVDVELTNEEFEALKNGD